MRHDAVSLLRQPPEIPGVRQHLQREAESRRPRARTSCGRSDPTPPALRHLRRRHGRRDGARATHAQRACHLARGSTAGRRQGNQPRRRAPRAREDGGSLPRASDDSPGGHEPALPDAPALRPRSQLMLAQLNWQVVRLDGDSSYDYARQIDGLAIRARLRLGDAPERNHRQPGVRAAFGPGDLSRRPRLPARRGRFRIAGGPDIAYDFILASQPWRARMSAQFKVGKVLLPLTQRLARRRQVVSRAVARRRPRPGNHSRAVAG